MNQLIMIFLISLLVLVHEAGHFFAARMCGIRVTRFGIGMPIGPSWKLFKWGHTVFYIHAFLFGGYVSFPEDELENQSAESTQEQPENQGADDSQANGSRDIEEEIEEVPQEELYESKTIAQKLFVVSAGVLMNIIFAIILVIFCAIFYQKLPTSTQNVFVDSFASKITSNIQEKGVIKGDKFEKINSFKIDSLYQLTFFAKNSKLFDDYAQEDLIEKNIDNLKKLNPNLNENILKGTIINLPSVLEEKPLNVSEDVLKGLEKYKKDGIKLNELQLDLRNQVYGKKTFETLQDITLNDLALALSDTYKPLTITFLRDGKEIVVNNIAINQEGMLGVMLKIEDIYVAIKTPKDAIVKSLDYIYSTTYNMLKGLWQLFCGKVSASDMHGVIAVVKVGGDIIASKGMLNGILLTAMISINLAIMNFLPIPALDGGHVMFLLIEKITGKKPSKEFGEKINNFFFMLLIVLMVAICYNDILALVMKKF